MLHYFNAISIEKNRRYLVIKGGLAWLLWQERVVITVVVLSGISNGLGVYQREEGEETVNTRKHMHNKTKSGARGVLTQR